MINLVDERQYILRYHHFIMTFVNRYMISNLNFRGILDLSVQFRLNRIRSRHFEKINSQRSELFLSQDTHPCKGLRYGGFSFSVLFLWPSLSVSDQFDLLILIHFFLFWRYLYRLVWETIYLFFHCFWLLFFIPVCVHAHFDIFCFSFYSLPSLILSCYLHRFRWYLYFFPVSG